MSEDYEARAHKQLQIESWSNAARTLLIRGATDGGPFAEQHVTNADRSRATDTFELHGIPTKIQISPSTAPVRRGECYVRVTLLLDGEPVQRLASAYLTDSKTLSWPPGQFEGFTEGPGFLEVVQTADPAAGAEVTYTIPTNQRARLRALKLVLVTDATVANRYAHVVIDDGANEITRIESDYAQVASKNLQYFFLEGFPVNSVLTNEVMRFFPVAFPLMQGSRIRTLTGNMVAGDDHGVGTLFLETWIEE